MLKRFKRAGVWALALSMAVTMTPVSAFADVETGESEPLAVQVDGGTPAAEAPAAEAPAPTTGIEVDDPTTVQNPTTGTDVTNGDNQNGNNQTEQEVTLDTKFGLSIWHTVIPYAPAAYGEVRSYGDKTWKTGADPKLQPAKDYTVNENEIKREYAYFRNTSMIYWVTMQEFWEYMGKLNASESGDPNNPEDVEDAGVKYAAHVADLKDATTDPNEPGFILERITSLTNEKDRPVYAIHMTAVDVTVKADNAIHVDYNHQSTPKFTVTETLGDYPEALDAQMKYNYGTVGRNTYVDAKLTGKLIPRIREDVTWSYKDQLKSVLGYSVVNHEEPKDGNEIIDLVHGNITPFESDDEDEIFFTTSDELNDVLTANSDVAEALESGDVDEVVEAIGTMSADEAFDMSKLYDPPLHVELAQGKLTFYDDYDPLPAGDGIVDKELEATQLDSSYNTTVKLTLPLTKVDPEEYYWTSTSRYGSGMAEKAVEFKKVVATKAEEAAEAQATSGKYYERYYDPLTYPKQKETIPEESVVVLNLADDFTLPVNEKDGKLDLSKLSLVDYRYYYEPEEKEDNPENVLTKGSDCYYKTYQTFVDHFKKWYTENVFSENKYLTKDANTGYYVRDLKGYKVKLPSYGNPVALDDTDGQVREELKDTDPTNPTNPSDPAVAEKTEPKVEVYGFGLNRTPREEDTSGGGQSLKSEAELVPGPGVIVNPPSGGEVDTVNYYAEDFEYLVIYLPEGLSGIPKEWKHLFGYPYETKALKEPCMIIAYQGSYNEGPFSSYVLNPLHYFEFQFEETLTKVSTASGTHGSFDYNGRLEKDSIKVVDSATLYRPSISYHGEYELKSTVKSEELAVSREDDVMPQEKPEEFYVPTVSYTVPGGGGGNGPGGRSSGGNSATITEPEVPLAELPELNKTDHVAYVIGYEDGTVRPENLITRAEVSTIFFRLLTDDSRKAVWSTSNSYTDTVATAWYNNAVSTLSNGGVLSGYTDGTFLPGGNITRAEFATIAARFDESAVDTSSVSFSDISGHWAENNIKRAAALGYITGYQDGSFKPNEPITRAEAMTLMNRVLGRDKITAAGLLDNMAKWSDNPPSAWYYVAVQEATNTHDYTIEGGVETWTSILANRDWAALEKEWATGAEKGAEVFQPVEEETPASEFEAGTEAEAGAEA